MVLLVVFYQTKEVDSLDGHPRLQGTEHNPVKYYIPFDSCALINQLADYALS